MRHKRTSNLILALSLLAVIQAGGCIANPVARKQKFYDQGLRDFARERYPEAIISFSRSLQIDPRFADAHYKLAQCQERQGNWGAALRELQRTVELQPENVHAQIDLGQIVLAGGRSQDAKDRAMSILHTDPKNLDAALLLSNADTLLGNLKDALQEAQDAVALAPEKAKPYINLAIIQQKAGTDDQAELTLKKALSVDPSSPAPAMALGTLYARRSRWADAQAQFQSAINLAPSDPQARSALAALYLKQGDTSAAEQVFTDARQQVPDDPAIYRLLGDYYMTQGNSAAALNEFGALSTRYQKDLQVRKTYIQLLIINHRLDDAVQLNDAILASTPQDAESLILRGQIQIQQNHFEESILTLRQALKLDPGSAMGHYQLGVAFQKLGQIQQAEGEWYTAVRIRPELLDAWSALGTSAAQRSDWGSLESIAAQFRKIAPGSPQAYLFHATAKFNQGDAASAEEDFMQLIQAAPQNALGYIKLGQLRTQEKRWNQAEDSYRQALARDPNSLAAIQGLVTLDFARNRPADAVRLLQANIERTSGNSTLFFLLGQAQLRTGQVAEAERALSRAVSLDDQNVAAVVLLAQSQVSGGNVEQGIASYQRAIELAPNNVELYVGLGALYESQGDWQKAFALHQKALSIQPDYAPAANNLAYIMLEHGGDLNVALSLAQTARRGLPALPNSADTLGWAYYHGGSFSVAAPLFEEAVKQAPSNPTYHYHLGLTYQKLNESVRARAELQRAITINPKSSVADQARHAISQGLGS
jgi:tetratricopeptide (TPR) repeat protein